MSLYKRNKHNVMVMGPGPWLIQKIELTKTLEFYYYEINDI